MFTSKLTFQQITLGLVFMATASCASLGSKFTAKKSITKNNALIYIYRVSRFMGSAGSPYLCVDGKVVGEVVNGGYMPLQLPPGKHQVYMKISGSIKHLINFNVSKNKTYYLRTDFSSMNNSTYSGGGLVGALSVSSFTEGSDKKNKLMLSLDKRAQQDSNNAGFLFVNPTIGANEIIDTKLFEPPKYKKNYCAQRKKTSKK